MKKILLILILVFPVFMMSKTVWIETLDTKLMLQDWGSPMVNKCVNGQTLSVAGVPYKKGIGTHSISRFLLNLDGKAKKISGFVGADDHNDFCCDMEFAILADQKTVWLSGIMRKGMPAKPFEIDLKGVQKIALMVVEAGDGIMYDHADWLETKIETSGKVVAELARPQNIEVPKYILTPKPSDNPKINGAKVFGLRSGNPFLYTIPATGKRPMSFSVLNLPKGLTVDKQTGLIRGTVEKEGTYNVILRAENELGYDSKVFRIEVGNRICLTPPMGWNSWNCWGLKVDEQKVKDAADFMGKELINHGWSYINIDDGWEANKRRDDGQLFGNDKFPDFKGLCDYVHGKGLKFGIYSSPGPLTCGSHVGSYKYEDIDAKTWADWGVDYLKYDFCYYSQVVKDFSEDEIKKPYFVMRSSLDKVKRDIVYCVGFGAPNVWNWGAEAGGNQWRNTRDITDEWNVVSSIGFLQDIWTYVSKPGQYNDPDMLVVGKLGMAWGDKVHDSYLTANEQYAHISLWCLQSAPLLIGCDMANIDEFTVNLLTNDEVIAVDQDPLVMPAKKIKTENGQIWYKYLEDGSLAVGFFNEDPYFILWDKSQSEKIQKDKYKMALKFADLNLKGKFKVRDLWSQKDLGVFENGFSTEVNYHGVTFVKITPEK